MKKAVEIYIHECLHSMNGTIFHSTWRGYFSKRPPGERHKILLLSYFPSTFFIPSIFLFRLFSICLFQFGYCLIFLILFYYLDDTNNINELLKLAPPSSLEGMLTFRGVCESKDRMKRQCRVTHENILFIALINLHY